MVSFKGVVNVFVLLPFGSREGGEWPRTEPFGGHRRARALPPQLDSWPHRVTVYGGSQAMPARAAGLGHGTRGRQEPRRVT
jgi:hypothetical protein